MLGTNYTFVVENMKLEVFSVGYFFLRNIGNLKILNIRNSLNLLGLNKGVLLKHFIVASSVAT